jgi:histidine ammonia-lyase
LSIDACAKKSSEENMTINVDGTGLTVDALVRVARHEEKVELAGPALERIVAGRLAFQRRLTEGEVIYGVNTGIGELCGTAVDESELGRFQEDLVRSHAAGIGGPAPMEWVRGAMLCRVNVHAHGRSGCRVEITQTLVAMLNRGVTPVVCLRGSVGACGDLAPMAQIALLMLGEGEAFYEGERVPGRVAMERAGIPIPGLAVRDGLAAINGANFIAAVSALQVFDIGRLLKQAEICACMTMEALGANMAPFHPLIHEVRGFAGSIQSAASIRKCLEGGELQLGERKSRVQDAYSLRSTPQIVGAARDALEFATRQVEIEMNGVGDNPILFPEHDTYLTGANFQGTPVSLPMDMMSAAVTAVCVLSERRVNRLLNPALSVGLPAFLSHRPGPGSGYMLSQYTAGALVSEQRILSAPASVQSIPAAADQEDFVSMGMTTCIKNAQILANSYGVIGIELLVASQALDMRGLRYGKGVEAARKFVREHIPHLEHDRELHCDHTRAEGMIREGTLLATVETAVGNL